MPERVWCQDDGHYNHLPTPTRPATLDEFWYWLFQHHTTIEHRQVKPKYQHVIIFWSDGSAFALLHPERWTSQPQLHFTKPPEVLRIGCDHRYFVTHQIGCYKECKCDKCGHEKVIDSSD